MSEEGKISRALRKSGGDRNPPPEPKRGEPGLMSGAGDAGHSRQGADSCRRVKGQCGSPDSSVVMVHDKWGEAASQIRAIRAKILAMDKDESPQVITVTSGTRLEGKTTVAFNLAAALSEVAPGRVVVVDGDVRSPGAHMLVDLEPRTGLYDILKDGVRLDDNVYETGIPGLDLISCSAADLDGQEGLLERQCDRLLAELRPHYSFIIIDTPPVIASSEARTFGKHSDGAIIVARLEKTPRDVVKRTVDELAHSGVRVIGCVLTHRKHHVPGIIYRLVGHSPKYYYSGYRTKSAAESLGKSGEEEEGKKKQS